MKKFRPMNVKKEYDYIWVGTNAKLRGLDEAIHYSKGKKLLVVGVDGKDTENVKYKGRVSHDKLPELYNKCKNIIYFGKIKGYPFVVLEAMACCLGVIASSETMKEIIERNEKGLCKIKPSEAIKIAEKFEWKNILKKYSSVYDKLNGD